VTGVWPWLAVAAAGALHGLNPAAGWALVAARSGAGGRCPGALRALAPVAIGHAASVAAIAALATLGLVAQRGTLHWLAGGLAVVAVGVHGWGHLSRRVPAAAAQAGPALWSCAMGLVQGAGLMLVPALIPLCLSGSPAREITASGSAAAAIGAVAVHMAALLAVAGAMGLLARRGWELRHRCAPPVCASSVGHRLLPRRSH